MSCKYCHLKTHTIDKCPTIICKICKDIGHPQWLCKGKKTNTVIINKKYSFCEEIKKKPEQHINKTISYYLKLQDELWGILI